MIEDTIDELAPSLAPHQEGEGFVHLIQSYVSTNILINHIQLKKNELEDEVIQIDREQNFGLNTLCLSSFLLIKLSASIGQDELHHEL